MNHALLLTGPRWLRWHLWTASLVATACGSMALAGPDSCPGNWRAFVPPGSGGIADVLSLPSGALVVGMRTGGLRYYERGPTGAYAWRSVVAGRGSVASNQITCLALFLGDLWVGTANAGISVFDFDTGAWSVFNTANSALPTDNINRLTPVGPDPIVADPGDTHHTLWASTNQGAAFYRFLRVGPISSWAWTLHDTQDGLPVSSVHDIGVQFVAGKRYTWFATTTNLVRWDGSAYQDFSNTPNVQTAERILVTSPNTVWFSGRVSVPDVSGTVPMGLSRMARHPITGLASWTHFQSRYGHDLSLDPAGRLWAGGTDTNNFDGIDSTGGFVHDAGTWCLFRSQIAGTISGDQVSAVHGMGEQAWFAQRDANVLDAYTTNWSTLRSQVLELPGFAGPVASGHGMTIVGGASGFTYRVDAIGRPLWTYRSYGSNPDDVTQALLVEGTQLWIGTRASGLRGAAMSPQPPRIAAPVEQHTTEDGLAGDSVQALALDPARRLWVGTSTGLSLRGNGYWLNFTPGNSPMAGEDVTSLAVDASGKLWIGTSTGGISVLDADAAGTPAWTSHSTAGGLASNDVRGLVRAPDDSMWAATAAGVCEWNAGTGSWTVHNAATGALPADAAETITVDARGRVWVDTTQGLAAREGSAWRHYHPTNSTLSSDDVNHLAAVGDTLWASMDDGVAIREEITGPIGEVPPVINQMVPASQPPGFGVVLNGQGFDARGPQFNQVFVGIKDVQGLASQPAEVLSVTANQIIFRVPELADDGHVRVVANCLEGMSAAELKIEPKITSFTPWCAGLGTVVTIQGAGFHVGGGVELRFGNGPWRKPALTPGAELRPGMIRMPIQAGDQEGKIQMRRQDGAAIAASPTILYMSNPQLQSYYLSQGIEGMPRIWGKRLIVGAHFNLGCHAATSGAVYWKKKDNTLQLAGRAFTDRGGATRTALLPGESVTFDRTVEFVAEFESSRSGWGDFFPLKDLAGVVCTLENNGTDLLNLELPASELQLIELPEPLKLKVMSLYWDSADTSAAEFWNLATQNLVEFARIFPQQDHQPLSGTQRWIKTYPTSLRFELNGGCQIPCLPWTGGFDSYVIEAVRAYLDPGPDEIAVGLVDPAFQFVNWDNAYSDYGETPGLWPTVLVSNAAPGQFEEEGDMGPLLAHTLGGRAFRCEGSPPHLGYGMEMRMQLEYLGISVPLTVNPSHPAFHSITGEALVNLSDPADIAQSAMSFGPLETGLALYPPMCYSHILELVEVFGPQGGGAGAVEPTLRLGFLISANGSVAPRISYLDDSGRPPTAPQPEGDHHAVVRDALGEELEALPFGARVDGGGEPNPQAYVDLRLPFPPSARSIAILHGAETLLTLVRSPSPPVVSFTSPAGGSFRADETIAVSWTASDPDGGSLQYALDYTADDGATWTPLPQYLTVTSFDWSPGFVPASARGRLRVRASDGFNTSTALSAPFTLGAAQPLVFLRSPKAGQRVLEGTLLDLAAGSMTAAGVDQGTFVWSVDGQDLPVSPRGSGSTHEYSFQRVGSYTVRVTLTDPDRLQAFQEVTVEVVADYDRDGLPNDYEQAQGLNPLDRLDALLDADGDSLTNLGEFQRGTELTVPDTDGDGAIDGLEVSFGTDPLKAESTPPSQPTLTVWPELRELVVSEGTAASDPRPLWIGNAGPGTLNWTLQHAVPWLEATPSSGTAPSAVTLTALPAGLAPGSYQGEVTIAAPGADLSPAKINVTLLVKAAPQPPVGAFVRGDTGGSLTLEISDPVATLTFLFLDASNAPTCLDAADSNDDGVINLSDPVHTLGYLFLGGRAPPPPFPGCGVDPTPDRVSCELAPACRGR